MRRFVGITMVLTVGIAMMVVTPARATLPGENGRIAFQMDFGIGAEIYTIKPSGRGIHQLTEVDGSA